MSMIKRLRMILLSNIHEKLDNAKNPKVEINKMVRKMERDLREFKADMDAAILDMNRMKRELDERKSEMKKFERYAKRALENNDEDRARSFLENKLNLEKAFNELEKKYSVASIRVEQMQLVKDKLTQDLEEISKRRDEILGKLATANSLIRSREGKHSKSNVCLSKFDELEEKVTRLLYEAEALEELRNGLDVDMDK